MGIGHLQMSIGCSSLLLVRASCSIALCGACEIYACWQGEGVGWDAYVERDSLELRDADAEWIRNLVRERVGGDNAHQ